MILPCNVWHLPWTTPGRYQDFSIGRRPVVLRGSFNYIMLREGETMRLEDIEETTTGYLATAVVETPLSVREAPVNVERFYPLVYDATRSAAAIVYAACALSGAIVAVGVMFLLAHLGVL